MVATATGVSGLIHSCAAEKEEFLGLTVNGTMGELDVDTYSWIVCGLAAF